MSRTTTMTVCVSGALDAALWEAVKARQLDVRSSKGVTRARATRFWERRRPKTLLTGRVLCGCCGSRFASVGRDYLACSSARGSGTCANGRGIRRSVLERIIIDGLSNRLMAPVLVEEFVAAVHEETNRQRREADSARSAKQVELASLERKLTGLIDAIAEGVRGPELQQRLDDLAERKRQLLDELSTPAAPPVRLHPGLAQIYRKKVERLREALDDPAIRDEALQILRALIERIEIHQAENGSEVEIVRWCSWELAMQLQKKPSLMRGRRVR